MAMNKIPTLVIGLGGVGCRIAAGLNQLLSYEDKQFVGAVGIDTNVSDLTTVKNQGLQTIRISDNRKVQDYLEENPELCQWFPVHPLLISRGLSAGAGQIRTISRLAALAAEKRGDFRPIESEINRITKNKAGGTKHTLAVVVTGSITGGTGAGMFLQIPYYIRNLLKNSKGLQNVIIRGMFVGPDITRNAQTSDVNRDAVSVNAYSCLKELNTLYMTQMFPEMGEKIKLDFYDDRQKEKRDIDWDVIDEASAEDKEVLSRQSPLIPYDYLYLIEGSNNTGSLGNPSMGTVERMISRTLFTLLFTPVVNDSMSIEDNFTLAQIDRSGMNRYASSGLCRLVYPVDLAREYVVLSNAKELVNKEWRLVDRRCEETVMVAQAKKHSDGHATIPTEAQNYCDRFTESVKGKNAPLGMLYHEAFFEDPVLRTETTVADRFFKQITDSIDQVCKATDIVAAKKACALDTRKMENLANANSAITNLENALETYGQLAENAISGNYARIANELFPSSVVSMTNSEQTGVGVYSYIAALHPVTARFFCYKLSLLLKKRIADAQAALDNPGLDIFDNADFDTRTAGKQTPAAALQIIKSKSNPIYKYLVSDASKTKKLVNILSSKATTLTNNISRWMEESLYLNVCQVMLERVERLSENYKLFFDTIGGMIELNDVRIRDLEALEFPIGEVGIYCSGAAMRKMAREYSVKNELSLPDETKQAIFKELFRITAGDLLAPVDESEYEKQLREKNNKTALAAVFDRAVLETLRKSVKKHGDSIVNLSAKQALVKEFELNSGMLESGSIPEKFKEQATAYAKERLTEAMDLAAPMLAVDSSALSDKAELVFLAMHPDCAELNGGKADASKTKETYFPGVSEASGNSPVHVLMDEEFAPSEIVCVRTQYLFEIEDLIKYNPDSLNAQCYFKRISNIGGKVMDKTSADAFKTVINPHLNRHWHQEGIIPAMTAAERRKSEKDKLRAFVYAVGLDCAALVKDDEDLYVGAAAPFVWHDLTMRSASEIKVCGNRIAGNYASLFNALDYNRNMKHRILKEAQNYRMIAKGYAAGEELIEEIMKVDFISDLIQPSTRGDEGDMNVYDIFLSMRDFMPREMFSKLFDGLVDALWEFTAYMFDGSAKLVNKATKNILAAIYENCAVAKKETAGEELTYGEKQIKEEHKQLMEKIYH